jgi:hypothetical protein
MGVLAAVFPHTGDIALDIARVVRRLVERWREETNEPVGLRHEIALDRVQGLHSPLGRCRTGDHRPGLGQGIDAAFVALRRAERGAVVIIGPAIPTPVPAAVFERLH